MHTGKAQIAAFDALQAFWPALQVLAGDVSAAVKELVHAGPYASEGSYLRSVA